MTVRVTRVYDPPQPDDGTRILVDGIWPRGISKEAAAVDAWRKDVAPSKAVRNAFGHQVERWSAFRRDYRAELAGNPGVAELAAIARDGVLTLVYSARDTDHNQAVVLAEVITESLERDDQS